MNLKILIIPILIIIIFISGCVGGGGIVSSTGLGAAILNFTSDIDTVVAGKSAKLSLLIENQGDNIIKDSESIVYLFGSNLVQGVSDGNQWNVSSLNLTLNKDLKPADPLRGIPADQREIKYTIFAPTNLRRGESKQDTFTVRFYYKYKTKIDTTVWVYSEAEAAALRAAGKSLEQPTYKYSKGPLEIEVTYAPASPILSSNDKNFTMYITIKNVGNGIVFINSKLENKYKVPSLSEDDINKINVTTNTSTGVHIFDCSGFVELRGKSAKLACGFGVDNIPESKKGISSIITLEYGYYIDSQPITLTAIGK